MELEETTNTTDELSTEEVGTQDTSTDALSDDVDEHKESAAVDDLEDVEHDGKQYKIPKELKSALMKNADYTRKTQELAESRQQIEAEREGMKEDMQDHGRLYFVTDRLQQFEQVDWNDLSNREPAEAQRLWIQYSQLKDAKAKLESHIYSKQEQRKIDAQHANAKQLDEGRASLAKDIKGWSPELAVKLGEFAKSEGWTKNELDRITPHQVKSLHRAYISDQLIKKQKPEQEQKEQAKPVPQLSSGMSKVRKSPTDMTDAEFSAWRSRTAKRK